MMNSIVAFVLVLGNFDTEIIIKYLWDIVDEIPFVVTFATI